jgi:hypothetical protein
MANFNSEEFWKEITSSPGYTRKINPNKCKDIQEKKVNWDMKFTPEKIKEIEQRHKENPLWMWEDE